MLCVPLSTYVIAETDPANPEIKKLTEQSQLLELQKTIAENKNKLLIEQAKQFDAYLPKLDGLPDGKITTSSTATLGTLGNVASLEATSSMANQMCSILENLQKESNVSNLKFLPVDSSNLAKIESIMMTHNALQTLNKNLRDAIANIEQINHSPNQKIDTSNQAVDPITITAAISALLQLSKIFKSSVNISTFDTPNSYLMFENQIYAHCNNLLNPNKVTVIDPNDPKNKNIPLVDFSNELLNNNQKLDQNLKILKNNSIKYKNNKYLESSYNQYLKLSNNINEFISSKLSGENSIITSENLNISKYLSSWIVLLNVQQSNIVINKQNFFQDKINLSSALIVNYTIYNNNSEIVKSNILHIVTKPITVDLRDSRKAPEEFYSNDSIK